MHFKTVLKSNKRLVQEANVNRKKALSLAMMGEILTLKKQVPKESVFRA